MKKLLSLVLVLMLALSAVSVFAEETEADVTEIQKYGNLVLSITGSELLEAGYAYGDIATVTINGTGYDMPVGSNYSDVDQGSMISWQSTWAIWPPLPELPQRKRRKRIPDTSGI